MRNFRSVLLAGAIIVGGGAAAFAQATRPAAMPDLAGLSSPDYLERERATAALLTDERLTPEDLVALYEASPSPEARQRLLAVARHKLIRPLVAERTAQGGAASLGVSLSPAAGISGLADADRPAARIAETFPGFPAYVFLRPGDLILSVDGQPIPRVGKGDVNERFKEMIKAHTAGDAVRLTLRRDRQDLAVRVPLASWDALNTLYTPDGWSRRPLIEGPWSEFRSKLSPVDPRHPQPLSVDLSGMPTAPAAPGMMVLPPPIKEEGADADE